MNTSTPYQNLSLLFMRVTVAAVFLYAGYAKLPFWSTAPEGMQAWMVALTKFLSIVEPLGAVAVLAGFLTRWAAAGLALIMAGSIPFVYLLMQAHFFTSMEGTGMDYNTLILAGCLMLLTFGPGRYAVDAYRK